MADPSDTDDGPAPKRRRISRPAAFVLVMIGAATALHSTLFQPETTVPPGWSLSAPFRVSDPITPLTGARLRKAASDPVACLMALQDAGTVRPLPAREDSDTCHIRARVEVSALGGTGIDPIETACETALRLAMWHQHGVQPAARRHLGTEVTSLAQIGSYNCRPIRTMSGDGTRWSTHATAAAIDITGFTLADGRRLRLIEDWDSTDAGVAAFLRATRDSACTWFGTVLGPEFNALHADHFHLQNRGWGTCR